MKDAATFFKAIRSQLGLITNSSFCENIALKFQNSFSTFIGLKKYYVRYKSAKAQRGKQLTLEILEKISSNLKSHFRMKKLWTKNKSSLRNIEEIEENINKNIEHYKAMNKLNLYAKGHNGVFDHHPNLNINYFKDIDTNEKAYWLGWIFAEGWITIHSRNTKGKPYYRFGVGLLKDGSILLKRFAEDIGFDIETNKPLEEEYTTSKGEIHKFLKIRIINNQFCKHLISHRFIVGEKKSKNIRLPIFEKHEQLLAFLLGYYDGDGTEGRSRITSGSKKFLLDILNSPFLNYKKKQVNGNKISLGANLMREMVANYNKSLPRKREYWEDWVDKRTKEYREG